MGILLVIIIIVLLIIGGMYCSSNRTSVAETHELLTKGRTSPNKIILRTGRFVKKQTQRLAHLIIRKKEKQKLDKPSLIVSCPACHKEFLIYSSSEKVHCPSCQQSIQFL